MLSSVPASSRVVRTRSTCRSDRAKLADVGKAPICCKCPNCRVPNVHRFRWYNLLPSGISDRSLTRGYALKRVDIVKWVATAIQLVGYGLTGLNIVLWNVLAFVIGIVLWFLVGVMWKDRAIMVVHVGAFIAILGGYFNS